jgi:hypothetical protein
MVMYAIASRKGRKPMARRTPDSKPYRMNKDGFVFAADSIKLVRGILKERNLKVRLQKTRDFLRLLWAGKIACETDFDPFLDDFIEKCLSDCRETGKYDQGLKLLEELPFSANQQKRFMDLAVLVFLECGKKGKALDWIDDVSYDFGKKSVIHLARKSEYRALHASKRFKKITGPKADLERFKAELKESMDMWKNDEYDNIKDALLDAKGLRKEANRLKTTLAEKARKHLLAVTKEAKKMMEADPEIKKYLKGIV